MVGICGAQAALKQMEQEKIKLEENLEMERLKNVAAQHKSEEEFKSMENRLSAEIQKQIKTTNEEKSKNLELIETAKIDASKIVELQSVIVEMEKDKCDAANTLKELSEKAEATQMTNAEEVEKLTTRCKKLTADLHDAFSLFENVQGELAGLSEEKEQMRLEIELLQQQLGNAVRKALEYEEELHKKAANLDIITLKVGDLETKLAIWKSKAENAKLLERDFHEKIEFLESTLKIQRANEITNLSELKEMEETVKDKDKQLVEYRKKKTELEVQVSNLSNNIALIQETMEKESAQWQTANFKLKNIVYLLTTASESIKSEMEEKLGTADDLRNILTAQVEARDQYIATQKKFMKKWMITIASEATAFENELCKKNEIIASTLVDQSQRATVVCDVLRKFKQKVMASQLELEQAQMEKLDLENQLKQLSATLESTCEELKKKDDIISNGQEQLIMTVKSKDELLTKNSILQERLDKMVTKFSTYSNQLEQKCAELKGAREGEANLNKHVISLTEELSTTKQEAYKNVNVVEDILKAEVEKRTVLESAIKKLEKNNAEAEQSIKALKIENKKQKATETLEIGKLLKQVASQKHAFDGKMLSTRHEYQRKLNAAKTQISDLKATIETEATSAKSSKAKIETLEASLNIEKDKSGLAFAEVSKLNITLQGKVAKIAEWHEKIIAKKSASKGGLGNDVISLKDKEELACLLKQSDIASVTTSWNKTNEEECNEMAEDKNIIKDKFSETISFKKDHAEDVTSGSVYKKPQMYSAMSIVNADREGSRLSREMSLDDD